MKNTIRKHPTKRDLNGKFFKNQTVTVNFTLSPQRVTKATKVVSVKPGESCLNATEKVSQRKLGPRIESNLTGLCLRVKSKG